MKRIRRSSRRGWRGGKRATVEAGGDAMRATKGREKKNGHQMREPMKGRASWRKVNENGLRWIVVKELWGARPLLLFFLSFFIISPFYSSSSFSAFSFSLTFRYMRSLLTLNGDGNLKLNSIKESWLNFSLGWDYVAKNWIYILYIYSLSPDHERWCVCV